MYNTTHEIYLTSEQGGGGRTRVWKAVQKYELWLRYALPKFVWRKSEKVWGTHEEGIFLVAKPMQFNQNNSRCQGQLMKM